MTQKCLQSILQEAQAEIERICGIPDEAWAECEQRLENLMIYGTTHPEMLEPPEKEPANG